MRVAKRQDLVAAARALAPQIRDARDELESGRRLPATLAQALDQAGLMQLYLPRSMGGPEIDPITYYHVIEELSKVDGSVGWCAFLSSDATYFAGWLKPEVGRALFGDDPHVRIAASVRAVGDAEQIDGAYRVTGRVDCDRGVDHAHGLAGVCWSLGDEITGFILIERQRQRVGAPKRERVLPVQGSGGTIDRHVRRQPRINRHDDAVSLVVVTARHERFAL